MHQQKDMETISITWRGKKFILGMNPDDTLKQLGDELQKLTDVKADTMRLIVPQFSNRSSTLLYPFSEGHSGQSLQELSLLEGKSIRMMGVPKCEVDELLQNGKVDLRIAGFEEEEKRLRQRMLGRPGISLKLPQGTYVFCDFQTLHLPGVELNPPPSEALVLMHRLAADPGIVAIMNKHRWRVGIMTEMAPVGYVGVSPKCILGFNKNNGEEISLRLRTDDLKGFRKYESIKKTLLHELAHMVFSEHDANFYALDKQLNQEAAALDWTRSRSHTLGGVRHSLQYEDEVYVDNNTRLTHKVGGKSSDQLANARESSVAAAYRRLTDTSTKTLAASEVCEEPDPDDSVLHGCQKPHRVDAIGKEQNLLNRNISVWKVKNEPDPDDSYNSQNKFEPDPDDGMGGEAILSEPYVDSCENITVEPDPDDSKNVQFVLALATERGLGSTKRCDEPDPDELEACLKGGGMVELDHVEEMETLGCQVQPRKNFNEPDPDDSSAGKHIIECVDTEGPHQDETMENQRQLDRASKESLPDDSQADVVMEAEPDPDDNMIPPKEVSQRQTDDHRQDDQYDEELKRIQDPVTIFCSRLQKAIEILRSEVGTAEADSVLQTLFKIIRNVIEHPDEIKFKRLRKANPIIQRTVANYKAAMEILFLIGFNEDVVLDEIGKAETYLILKRNDPGLLWLAKSSLEACIAY